VNPVDTKIRGARHQGSASDGTGKPRVLGWDAASVVVDKGSAVSGFAVGDEVYYAGELERPVQTRNIRPWTSGLSDGSRNRSVSPKRLRYR
jgi:NADPH:quinone reductase-like Zn-dependent oxidoreductase